MKSYDKIRFENNIDTEEFVITILRDETLVDINEGVKDGFDPVYEANDRVNLENDRVKNEIIQIYAFIEQNPLVKIATIEEFTKKSDKTVRRYLKILKDNGLIEYIGSDKTGGYKIV